MSLCPICGYKFESGPFFQTHVASHRQELQDELLSRERPQYTCSLCNNTFNFDDRQTEQISAHSLWHMEDQQRKRQETEALALRKQKWDKLYALKHPVVAVVPSKPIDPVKPQEDSKLTRKLTEKPRRSVVDNIPEEDDPLTLTETIVNYWRRFVSWIMRRRWQK